MRNPVCSSALLLLCGGFWLQLTAADGAPAQNVFRGKQLTAVTSASTGTMRPGQRVSLILGIQLNPGMHVYAPGAAGYIPVAWSLDPSGIAAAGPVNFPKPVTLYLAAIGEKMPVYQGSVQLIRQITAPDPSQARRALDANGRLVIRGVLSYQACDDRMCYRSRKMPVEWSFLYQGNSRRPAASVGKIP